MNTHNIKPIVIKPGTPMKINGVIYKDYVSDTGTKFRHNRYAHEAVYSVVSGMREFQSLMEDDHEWLYPMLNFNLRDKHITEVAARVAFIYRKVRSNISSLHNLLTDKNDQLLPYPFLDDSTDLSPILPPRLTPKLQGLCVMLLKNIFYCTPNQGIGNNLEKQYSCGLYRLCPWCRYEKSLHIFKQFAPHLNADKKKVCVTHFLTPCNSGQLDVNSDPATYTKAIRHACKGKDKGWEKDFVITLPYRTQISNWLDGEADRYSMAWRTSIITLSDSNAKLQTPSNAFPKTKSTLATFLSDGTWHRFPATKAGLGDALKTVMIYPKEMLVNNHDNNFVSDVLTVLAAGDRDRAVSHGF